MPTQLPPTVEQLYNLVDRAERKGGLTSPEGERLRDGIRALSGEQDNEALLASSNDYAELRRKYDNQRKTLWRWKRRVEEATESQPAPGTDAAAALYRVSALAQRWAHIPAKRAAAAAIFSTIKNRD